MKFCVEKPLLQQYNWKVYNFYYNIQQIWARDDYDDLITRLSSSLPYSRHFLRYLKNTFINLQ